MSAWKGWRPKRGHKSQAWWCSFSTPVLGRWRQEDPWGWLAARLLNQGAPGIRKGSCLEIRGDWLLREDTKSWPLAFTDTQTQKHTYNTNTHRDEDTHTHTNTHAVLHTHTTQTCTHRYRPTQAAFAGETLWSQDTQPMLHTRLLPALTGHCSKWILQMIRKAPNPVSKSCKTVYPYSDSRVEKNQGDSSHKIESDITGTSSMGPCCCRWSVQGYGWVASTRRGQPPADDRSASLKPQSCNLTN